MLESVTGKNELKLHYRSHEAAWQVSQTNSCLPTPHVPAGSPSPGGDVVVYVRQKPTEPAQSFLFCSCVYLCLYGPLNSISFLKFSHQLSTFLFCSSGHNSALLVLSTTYFSRKVSPSPDIILCGWLGLKHQVTNQPHPTPCINTPALDLWRGSRHPPTHTHTKHNPYRKSL